MAIHRLGEDMPRLAARVWVADSASVIGRVHLAEDASVWYGATIRGDNEAIHVGEGSNVQDGAVLHTDAGFALEVGAGCTVGHQAVLHGCTVGAGSLIGIRAVVLNGARIGARCLVAAGALVTEGKDFPDGALIMGAPAKMARMLEPAELERLDQAWRHYMRQAQRHMLAQRVA